MNDDLQNFERYSSADATSVLQKDDSSVICHQTSQRQTSPHLKVVVAIARGLTKCSVGSPVVEDKTGIRAGFQKNEVLVIKLVRWHQNICTL